MLYITKQKVQLWILYYECRRQITRYFKWVFIPAGAHDPRWKSDWWVLQAALRGGPLRTLPLWGTWWRHGGVRRRVATGSCPLLLSRAHPSLWILGRPVSCRWLWPHYPYWPIPPVQEKTSGANVPCSTDPLVIRSLLTVFMWPMGSRQSGSLIWVGVTVE